MQISLQYSPLLLRLHHTNNSGPCFEDMDINDLYVLQQKTRLMSVAPPSSIETSKEKKTTVSNFVINYVIRLKQ